jgi:hypothetical protein
MIPMAPLLVFWALKIFSGLVIEAFRKFQGLNEAIAFGAFEDLGAITFLKSTDSNSLLWRPHRDQLSVDRQNGKLCSRKSLKRVRFAFGLSAFWPRICPYCGEILFRAVAGGVDRAAARGVSSEDRNPSPRLRTARPGDESHGRREDAKGEGSRPGRERRLDHFNPQSRAGEGYVLGLQMNEAFPKTPPGPEGITAWGIASFPY